MSEIDLKAMCDAARWRLHTSINRSAAQNIRRMKELWDSQKTYQDNDSDGLRPSKELAPQEIDKRYGNACVIVERLY